MNIDDREYVKKLIWEYSMITGNPYITGTDYLVNDLNVFILLQGMEFSSEDVIKKYIGNMETLISAFKLLKYTEHVDKLENKNKKLDNEWLEKNLNSIP